MTRHLLPALLASLLSAALAGPASAAVYRIDGVIDSGSLAGTTYSGSVAFDDPQYGFDGAVELEQFTLSFLGQSYTLATADAATVPAAVFSAGTLLGLEFLALGSGEPASRPLLQLVPGFFSAGDAFLAYDTTGAGTEGFGSVVLTAVTVPVPEPGTGVLLLAGLGALAHAARRRRG